MKRNFAPPWTLILVVLSIFATVGGLVAAKLFAAQDLVEHSSAPVVVQPPAPHAELVPPAVAVPSAAPQAPVAPATQSPAPPVGAPVTAGAGAAAVAPAIAELVNKPSEKEVAAGLAVYQEVFEAFAALHRNLRPPEARQKFIEEWQHKHDKDFSLGTEKGLSHAIDELIWSLKQPHDHYEPPAATKAMLAKVDGKIAGIGLPLSQLHFVRDVYALRQSNPTARREDYEALLKLSPERPAWVAEDPPADGPAAKAGIRRGDLVLKLNGQSVDGRTLAEIVEDIRGEPTTKLVLNIKRQGVEEPFDVPLVRSVVQAPVVRPHRLPEGVVQIKLQNFMSEFSDAQMASALKNAVSGNGVILDLRSNGGGNVDRQILIAEQLIDEGLLYTRIYRDGDDEVTETVELIKNGVRVTKVSSDPSKAPLVKILERQYQPLLPKEMPLVVIIDGGSASASEIIAGALQVRKRATLVGVPSNGKGVGQKWVPIAGGKRSVRVTNFEFRPGGVAIDGVGLIPDREVALPEWVDPLEDPDADTQLVEGRAVIADLRAGKPAPWRAPEDIAKRRVEIKLEHEAHFARELKRREAVLNGDFVPDEK